MPVSIDYSRVAREQPGIIAPWHQTERALYFRTAEQAGKWAAEFGGVAVGRVVRMNEENAE